MLRIYKEHKVNPFAVASHADPWPVLLALFFVFANTIIFRGVPSCGCPTCRARSVQDHSHPPASRCSAVQVGQSASAESAKRPKMMVYFIPVHDGAVDFARAQTCITRAEHSAFRSIPDHQAPAARSPVRQD